MHVFGEDAESTGACFCVVSCGACGGSRGVCVVGDLALLLRVIHNEDSREVGWGTWGLH